MKNFEYNGTWWFPEFPDHRVSGTLRFDPENGATLETIGDNFTAPITELFGVPKGLADTWTLIPNNVTIGLICGATTKGEMITLYKCREGGQNWSRGYIGATYIVSTVFVGCHFENLDDVKFDSLSIHYTHLNEWVGRTGFEGGGRKTKSGKLRYVRYKYTPPQPITYKVRHWNISFRFEIDVKTDRAFDVHAKQTTYVEIETVQPTHYETYYKEIESYFRSFLSLGLGRGIYAEITKGSTKNCGLNNSEKEPISQTISIFNAEGQRQPSKERLSPWDYLFRYSDLSDNFEHYLNTWFAKLDKLSPIHNLYFGLFYIPSMYLHLEFLSLTQTLEAYHRRLYGGYYVQPSEYEPIQIQIVQSLPAGLDPSHSASLKSKIKYGYEYSLRKRLTLILTSILSLYKDETFKVVGNHKIFVDRVVNTRNYLTHYTEELEELAARDAEDLNQLTQQLKLLIQLCFMAELGIPQVKVKAIVSNNYMFKNWREVLD